MGDSTASDRVLSGTGLAVTIYGGSQPDIYLAAGEGGTYQRTDMRSLDSESNACPDAGSTASAAVLDGGSTTTIGLACANSGGSLVLILGDSQDKVQPSSMESLSSDIVQEVLSRVPAESVLECKLVCMKWVTLIRGSNFAKMHLTCQLNRLHDGNNGNHNLAAKVESCLLFACRIIDEDGEYRTLLFHGGQISDRISSNDEKYIYNENLKRIYHPRMHTEFLSEHFVGSCNGLVCALQLHDTILDPIYICNPLTREYVYLPQLVVKKEDVGPHHPDRIEDGVVNMFHHTACGFGYLRSTNEYKVVRIRYFDYQEGYVEVYTLGSGYGWRAIGKLNYRLDVLNGGRGTYANDVIYWISHKQVVAFDLSSEEFRLVSVPPCMKILRHGHVYGLVALGRHLCLYMDDKLRVEIWSLKKCSDSKETWCMEFEIDYQAILGSRQGMLQPILLTKNGEIILLFDESTLYLYDPDTAFLKMISDEASTANFEGVEATAHVNTFVSLETMGENSKRYTVRRPPPSDDVIDESDPVVLGEDIDMTRIRLV